MNNERGRDDDDDDDDVEVTVHTNTLKNESKILSLTFSSHVFFTLVVVYLRRIDGRTRQGHVVALLLLLGTRSSISSSRSGCRRSRRCQHEHKQTLRQQQQQQQQQHEHEQQIHTSPSATATAADDASGRTERVRSESATHSAPSAAVTLA